MTFSTDICAAGIRNRMEIAKKITKQFLLWAEMNFLDLFKNKKVRFYVKHIFESFLKELYLLPLESILKICFLFCYYEGLQIKDEKTEDIMNVIFIIFVFTLYTSITGTIMYGIQGILKVLMKKKNDIIFLYYSLNSVALSFIIPVIALSVWLGIGRKGIGEGIFFSIPELWWWAEIISMIWIIGAVSCLSFYLKEAWGLFRIRKESFPCEDNMEGICQDCCRELGIKRTIRLYQSYAVEVPFIRGIIFSQIYLPVQKFQECELRVILTHELIHHCHKDIFLKRIMIFVMCIHWYHPLILRLSREMDQWNESFCDMHCCEHMGITKSYFKILLTYSVKTNRNILHSVSALYQNGIKGRILRMRNYQIMKRKNKRTAFLAAIVFIFLGSCIAFTIGNEIIEVSCKAVDFPDIKGKGWEQIGAVKPIGLYGETGMQR